MTEEEKELVLLLNDVYERYSALPEQHKDDMAEFVNALHVLQHLIMIRSVRRQNRDLFPFNLQADAMIRDVNDMTPIRDAISNALNKALNEGA